MNSVDIEYYSKTMPEYRASLDFLQRILDFQASLVERLELDPPIELAMAHEKWRAGQPLFDNEPLSFPAAWFREALVELCPVLPKGAIQVALNRLLASNLMTPTNIETLLDGLIIDSDACIQQLANNISAEPNILVFLLRTVLSPFFQKQARLYQECLEAATWRRGVCPMCGSEPVMARLDNKDGQRFLACSLCRTEWSFDRLRCPFCESDDQPRLRYFNMDDDEAYRVDCCDHCQRYLKTIDERRSGRPANLWIEEVITTHLDVLAKEQGYHQ